MAYKQRPKLSDINKNSVPVFGKIVPAAEAFPQIAEIKIEMQIQGPGPDNRSYRQWTINAIPRQYINCDNPLCYGGGVDIGSILSELVSERKTEAKITRICVGREGARRRHQCSNLFIMQFKIKYKDEPKPDLQV